MIVNTHNFMVWLIFSRSQILIKNRLFAWLFQGWDGCQGLPQFPLCLANVSVFAEISKVVNSLCIIGNCVLGTRTMKTPHIFGQSFIILAIVHRKKCQPLQTPFNMHAENVFFLTHAKLFVLGLLKWLCSILLHRGLYSARQLFYFLRMKWVENVRVLF